VIIPVPAWTSFNHLARLAGGKVVEVPLTDGFDIDPEAIARSITPKTKAIIINSPNNPTGATFSKQALAGLADALKGKDITVIADDIYTKLVYDRDFTLVPTCGFDKVIIVNGFSKSQVLTGWRIGYCIAEGSVSKAINKLIGHTMGNASLPSQHAALAAMSRGDVPPEQVKKTLQRNLKLVEEGLASTPLKYKKPGGAFYVFLDLRPVTDDSAEWCGRLMEKTGVALVPGEAFSAPGFARLTYSADEQTLKKALKLIKEFTAASRSS
jgi:aspartate/methionine/tyrosine aminotransferase